MAEAHGNTVWLLTVDTSIGPEKGIDRRGCRLKPSSVLMTSMSAQSDGRAPQFGFGRFTRSPVFWSSSLTVKRSLGNGEPVVDERSKSASTSA
jgi:hypothetical protein